MAITTELTTKAWGNNWIDIIKVSGTYATGGFDYSKGVSNVAILLTNFGDVATLTSGKIVLSSGGTEITADTAVSGYILSIRI